VTELARRWWVIHTTGGRLPDESAAVLERLFALAADSGVAVREPEVWRRAAHWPAAEYHDGYSLTAVAAVSLIHKMIASAEFWCRLVTDLVEVHVAEDLIYIGTVGPEPAELVAPAAEPVDSSPYAIDRTNFSYYPPADDGFWRALRKDVDSGAGEVLMLQQWAAGFGGERWHLVASLGDLEAVRRVLIPRALYAVFRCPRLVRRSECSGQPISAVLGEEPLLANVRVFRDLGVFPLSVEHVASDQELARMWESLGARGSVFLWDDNTVASYAAQPDADGRVRVASSFQ
jgi:hypothetical protein